MPRPAAWLRARPALAARSTPPPPTSLQGFVIVPQQSAYIVERLGKYERTLTAGFYPLIPFVDRIAYVHSLKETALTIPGQAAITRDNVTITIDGVLYVRRYPRRPRAPGAQGGFFLFVTTAP